MVGLEGFTVTKTMKAVARLEQRLYRAQVLWQRNLSGGQPGVDMDLNMLNAVA